MVGSGTAAFGYAEADSRRSAGAKHKQMAFGEYAGGNDQTRASPAFKHEPMILCSVDLQGKGGGDQNRLGG